MTTDDREIGSVLRDALAGKVGKERFELWFGDTPHLHYDGRTVHIGVPNQFLLQWMRANFRRQIEEACQAVLGSSPIIEFYVEQDDEKQRVEQPSAGKEKMVSIAAVRTLPASSAGEKPPAEIAEHRKVPASSALPQAAVASGRRRRFAALDTFVVGECNRLAKVAAEQAIVRPGKVTPLMFFGPTSVGKTHLLEAIWTEVRKTRRMTAIYLSAEQFTSYFLEALRGSGLPNFRRKYRGVELLLIDDVQFFLGKRATQVELLYTIDSFLREGRQLVFAADRSPSELAELGPELTTRLAGGLVCQIEPPDFDTRQGILRQLAARMEVVLPNEVISWIAAHCTEHARQLAGAVCRLQAAAEAYERPIDPALAEEVLEDLTSKSNRLLRLPDIEKAVCEAFGLAPTSLKAAGKEKRVSHPRMLAMWLARKHTRAALSEIGRYFGRRSHSTVVSAQKRVERWMAAGRALELADRRCSIDDAVRQIERRLTAG